MAVSVVREVRVSGPLARFQEGLEAELAERGYAPLSAVNQLYLMAHLSRWLQERGLEAGDLDLARVDAYLADRRRAGYTCWLSRRGLAPLLGYLRGLGTAPVPQQPVAIGPVEEFLERYRVYLVEERGLVASTICSYLDYARRFVSGLLGSDGVDLERLTAADVNQFVVGQCVVLSTTSAKHLVTAMRSLLRFLLLAGLVERDLVGAVPAVASWRGSYLPRALPPEQVAALLRSCDRRRRVGRRDFAILTVLARLGLRAGEVAGLELDDIDWRRGEVVVRGKGRRDERLPLPADVGQAVVDYVRRGRPSGTSSRRVFIAARAPYGPVSVAAVKHVVRHAAERAGLERVSAHRLRHTVATEVLGAGGSLAEVGQVLRHRDAVTTAIYAKVDQQALAALAVPWPAGGAA